MRVAGYGFVDWTCNVVTVAMNDENYCDDDWFVS